MRKKDNFDRLREAGDFEELKKVYLDITHKFFDGKITYVDFECLTKYFRHIALKKGWR